MDLSIQEKLECTVHRQTSMHAQQLPTKFWVIYHHITSIIIKKGAEKCYTFFAFLGLKKKFKKVAMFWHSLFF